MDSENTETTPLLHKYVPPRQVYARGVAVERLSEDILIVKESLWSRIVSLAFAATIGVFSSLFLYWSLLQPLIMDSTRVTVGRCLVAVLPSLGVLLSLTLPLRMLLTRPIRLDRKRGAISNDSCLFGGWEHRLTDLLAIQVCYGKSDVYDHEKGSRPVTLNYQVNLVFRDTNLTRRNVSQQRYLVRIRQIAREIATFLDVPVVNYVGRAGTMDAGDAEIRRLLNDV
ncbi:hypothetical protein NZK35_18865 [Stieleria sp. ICT_E10.1]|uniref:hypothetical protein n=1 Tax=Stieleria sedimenti TaxID=2976331 RepID=UPI00217FA775|nr:hypothetical protein [Stieleria sedimenti]MCS7468720.1 hypothetical protein [Stieleria sedimenti]